HHVTRLLPVLVALGAGLGAQDIIAVNFAGQAFALDSNTGTGTLLGSTGKVGHNAMARSGKQLFVNEQVGSGTSAQYFLDILDEANGTMLRSVPLTRDIRSLAPGGQFKLLGIAQASPSDDLVSIDLRHAEDQDPRLVFHFQHAALDSAPGGLVVSNGVTL